MRGCTLMKVKYDPSIFGLAVLLKKSGWKFSIVLAVGPFLINLGADAW